MKRPVSGAVRIAGSDAIPTSLSIYRLLIVWLFYIAALVLSAGTVLGFISSLHMMIDLRSTLLGLVPLSVCLAVIFSLIYAARRVKRSASGGAKHPML